MYYETGKLNEWNHIYSDQYWMLNPESRNDSGLTFCAYMGIYKQPTFHYDTQTSFILIYWIYYAIQYGITIYWGQYIHRTVITVAATKTEQQENTEWQKAFPNIWW